MSRALRSALLSAAFLSACATAPKPQTPAAAPPAPAAAAPAPAPAAPAPAAAATGTHYRCDHGLEFSVRYGADSAVVDAGQQGRDELLRDAGGVTPRQAVYSNERLRAEFGLGENGQGAVLHYAEPPLVAHCTREDHAG
jgi:hypothetical protein